MNYSDLILRLIKNHNLNMENKDLIEFILHNFNLIEKEFELKGKIVLVKYILELMYLTINNDEVDLSFIYDLDVSINYENLQYAFKQFIVNENKETLPRPEWLIEQFNNNKKDKIFGLASTYDLYCAYCDNNEISRDLDYFYISSLLEDKYFMILLSFHIRKNK